MTKLASRLSCTAYMAATTIWSAANGLETLLIDGPLEMQIGTLSDRKKLIRAVGARLSDEPKA